MNREEIISKGAPVEPNCFETDREEQWYKVGLYEGATANPWHSVADGDLPQNNTYCFFSIGTNEIEIGHVMDGCVHFNSTEKPWTLKDMDYWMEIPKLPK